MGRKVRLVTPEQFAEGYYTFDRGMKMNHKYEIAWRDSAGNYGVYEPEATEALSNEQATPNAKAPDATQSDKSSEGENQ